MKSLKKIQLNQRIVILYLITLVAIPLLQVFLLVIFPGIEENEETLLTFSALSNLVWYTVLTTLLFITAKTYLFKNQWVSFKANLKRSILLIILGVALMFISNMLINGLFTALGRELNPENQASLELIAGANMISTVSLIIFAGLLAPIAEEIVFRKGVYGILYEKFGNVVAIIGGAFFFGLIHVLLDLSNFINILPYFGLGLILSFMYYYSGKSIFVPIAMHMVINITSLIAMYIV